MEVSISHLIDALVQMKEKYGDDVSILIGHKSEVNGVECTTFDSTEHYLVGEKTVCGCNTCLFKIKGGTYDGNEGYDIPCVIDEKK